MPTLTVEQQDLWQLLGKNYAVEKFEPLLDYVKGELKDYHAENGELKIELKDTNRPDLWSPEGIARQIRCRSEALNYESLLNLKKTRPEKFVLVDKNIRTVRPYIGAFIAKGVSVTEQFLIQMIQTQEKLCDGYGKKRELIAIGIYNADKITFPIHYNAVKPDEIRFVPLGCEEKMDLAEILETHPKGIEFGGIVQQLERYPILVDDTGDVLSFPPVINSRTSGEVLIGDDHLFIEITGLDLNMTLHAINILAYNFYDRGCEIEPVTCVYPYDTIYGKQVVSPYPLSNSLEVELFRFEDCLGESYSQDAIVDYLRKYGLIIQEQKNSVSREEPTLTVSTYPYRQDYMHPMDVVEDFAISVGFNTFDPVMPERFTVGHLTPMTLFEDRVRDTMIGFGFEEVILNILSKKEVFCEQIGQACGDVLEINNPMSESYSALRNSLIPSLLNVEASSSKSLYPHRVFEVGEVVNRRKSDNHGWSTRTKLTALIAHAGANFSELGSYLTHLAYSLFWEMRIQALPSSLFIDGRAGEILVNEKAVGVIGEAHPEILERWNIKMPIVLFELDLSAIL